MELIETMEGNNISNTNEPLVSVLMTAYNREQYIAEAIESVINSTYQNWELIIVDDGSKDNTVFIAKSYRNKDDRIRLYINEINLGDYPNRNRAMSYAKGEYIMWCDSDDTLMGDGIKYCVESMLQFPHAYFGIYCVGVENTPFMRSPTIAAEKNFFGEPFLGVGPGGTIIKRIFFSTIGKYPEKYGPADDMYFNIKVICYINIVLIPKQFSCYRIHDQQERNNIRSYLLNGYLFYKDAFQELPIPLNEKKINWLKKKNKRRFFVNILNYIRKTGELNHAVAILKKADFTFKDFLIAVFQF